jgi:hypothetical protein
MVSLTIGSYVARLLTLKPVPATYFPPGLKDAQRQLQSWLVKRQELRAQLTEAEGNISEYHASRLQAEFQSTAEFLGELKAVEEEDRLLRELQHRSDRRRGLNGNHIPTNHEPRTRR